MTELVGLAILGYFIAEWFTPIQQLKDKLKVYNWPLIGTALYCSKCTSFWLTLIVTNNIYYAAINAIIAYMFAYLINTMEYLKR